MKVLCYYLLFWRYFLFISCLDHVCSLKISCWFFYIIAILIFFILHLDWKLLGKSIMICDTQSFLYCQSWLLDGSFKWKVLFGKYHFGKCIIFYSFYFFYFFFVRIYTWSPLHKYCLEKKDLVWKVSYLMH